MVGVVSFGQPDQGNSVLTRETGWCTAGSAGTAEVHTGPIDRDGAFRSCCGAIAFPSDLPMAGSKFRLAFRLEDDVGLSWAYAIQVRLID